MTNRSKDLLSSTFNELRVLDDIGNDIISLAKSFGHTGNTIMNESLFSIGCDILDASRQLRNNYSEESSIRLKDADQSTANMLGAVMASLSNDGRIR
jgi:hypothetical protein